MSLVTQPKQFDGIARFAGHHIAVNYECEKAGDVSYNHLLANIIKHSVPKGQLEVYPGLLNPQCNVDIGGSSVLFILHFYLKTPWEKPDLEVTIRLVKVGEKNIVQDLPLRFLIQETA